MADKQDKAEQKKPAKPAGPKPEKGGEKAAAKLLAERVTNVDAEPVQLG